MSYWQILAAVWLLSGMATLYLMDRTEKQDGGDGRFRPLNFANSMTIVTVLLFWPVVLIADVISRRRQAQGKDDDSVIWKAVLIMIAPFLILFVPILVLALIVGFIRRTIRRTRGEDPDAGAPCLLQIPTWPTAEQERSILIQLTGARTSAEPPDPAVLQDTPEARLLEIAWVYVGLRLAQLPEEEVFRRMEEGRGATHGAHPGDLRAYLQWRLQQDDPGGPMIDPARFAHVADVAVNWVCDRYQESPERDFEEPDHLVEVSGLEAATPRPVETALLGLLMDEGDELYRCMSENGDPSGLLLIREGYAVAHLPGELPLHPNLALA